MVSKAPNRLRYTLSVVRVCGQLSGEFGRSVALVDMNADGHLDLAVGSPSAGSSLLQYHGAVYIYLGRRRRRQSSVTQSLFSSQPNIVIHCTVRTSSTDISPTNRDHSCPWVGLTHGLGCVGLGRDFSVFGGRSDRYRKLSRKSNKVIMLVNDG